MPIFRMKKIWDYCKYNKPFFLLILLIFGVISYIAGYYFPSDTADYSFSKYPFPYLLLAIFFILSSGYGMLISRDVMNNGFRLPKIMIKDTLVLGIKYFILFIVYFYIQQSILELLSDPLNFPDFDLEDLLIDFPNTINLFFSHSLEATLTFLIVGTALFYCTLFVLEIGYARLADMGSIKSAFNLIEIKRDIDLVGWKYCVKDFTMIILTIVFFAYFKYIVIPVDILDTIWQTLLNFLIFATQFWGIGFLYKGIKEKKLNNSLNESN